MNPVQTGAQPPAVRLRNAQPGDIPSIVEIEQATFSDPWSRASFHSALDHSNMRVMVAVQGDRVVGYAVAIYAADEGELANIAVLQDCRRSGVGAALLYDMLEEGWRRGARQVLLELRQSNLNARRLYEKMGFRELLRRPRYYSGPVEDAIVMIRKRLGDNGL